MTVFVTTHRLEEAERLCDRVAIIGTSRPGLRRAPAVQGETRPKTGRGEPLCPQPHARRGASLPRRPTPAIRRRHRRDGWGPRVRRVRANHVARAGHRGGDDPDQARGPGRDQPDGRTGGLSAAAATKWPVRVGKAPCPATLFVIAFRGGASDGTAWHVAPAGDVTTRIRGRHGLPVDGVPSFSTRAAEPPITTAVCNGLRREVGGSDQVDHATTLVLVKGRFA